MVTMIASRHQETEFNRGSHIGTIVLQSVDDEPLNMNGLIAAYMSAIILGRIRADEIDSTPLVRGYDGARFDAIRQAANSGVWTPVTVDPRIVEVDFAGHSSVPLEETKFRNPGEHMYYCFCPPSPHHRVPLTKNPVVEAEKAELLAGLRRIYDGIEVAVKSANGYLLTSLPELIVPYSPRMKTPVVRAAETKGQVFSRVYRMLVEAHEKHPRGIVKSYTHGQLIAIMDHLMLHEPPKYNPARTHSNGNISIFRYDIKKNGKLHPIDICINCNPKQALGYFICSHR